MPLTAGSTAERREHLREKTGGRAEDRGEARFDEAHQVEGRTVNAPGRREVQHLSPAPVTEQVAGGGVAAARREGR